MAKSKTQLHPDIIFKCRKCSHLLYIDIKKFLSDYVDNMPECDECGEESNDNWMLVSTGNYLKDYGDKI